MYLKPPRWLVRWALAMSAMLGIFAAVGAVSPDPGIKRLATQAAYALVLLIFAWAGVGVALVFGHFWALRHIRTTAPLVKAARDKIAAISARCVGEPTADDLKTALSALDQLIGERTTMRRAVFKDLGLPEDFYKAVDDLNDAARERALERLLGSMTWRVQRDAGWLRRGELEED